MSMQVGAGLLGIADPDQEGTLLSRIAALRQELTDEIGYIIPNIRVMDSTKLEDNEYIFVVRGNVVASGFVYPDKFMVSAEQWDEKHDTIPDDCIVGIEPNCQTQAYWISDADAKNNPKISAAGATDVIITHLKEVLIKHVDEILTKSDTLKLMELVRSQDHTLVNDLVPELISATDLRKIFVNLIREKVSIKDIVFIFERLNDYARYSKEPDILSERMRVALSRQICLANSKEYCNVIYAVNLSEELENLLRKNQVRTELGSMFKLLPAKINKLLELTSSALLYSHNMCGYQPVILCSPQIRLPLFQLLVKHIPTIVVLSYSELIDEIKVENVFTIGEE